MEDYSLGSTYSTINTGEVGGVARVLIYESKIPLRLYEPTRVKKFVTGKGNAPKSAMCVNVYTKWKEDFSQYNELGEDLADAFSIAKLLDLELKIKKNQINLDIQQKNIIEIFTEVTKANKIPLKGKEFIFRSSSAVTKVLGRVGDIPPLSKEKLIEKGNNNGGIVLIGSYVNKTTQQFEALRWCKVPLEFIEFNQHMVLKEKGLQEEVARVIEMAEKYIKIGKNVVVYTRRERFDLDTDDKDKQLMISVQISDAVTSVIGKLSIRPNFIIAKGGITSSDVGTKALKVKKARVMGQIKPGIPVWMTGEESKFPKMPYVIFPGNVGEVETLKEIVDLLS
jgi:uncharacterized protein YgbK (DUF1537 family)